MTDSSPGSVRFPLVCPACGAPEAAPCEAASVLGHPEMVRLRLRCRTCQHEWDVEIETDSLHGPDKPG